MKKLISFALPVLMILVNFSCSKNTIADCEKNHTGSITISNNGSFMPTGTADFYNGNTKLASLNNGQQATINNLSIGTFTMLVKIGPDTLYVDTYYPDTITQCQTLAYKTSDHYVPVSDRRLKKDISPLENALGDLSKLNVYSFHYQAPKDYKGFLANGKHFGFLAQELKEVYPDFVQLSSNGYYAVNYQEMIPLLAKGMQEQQQQISALKNEVAELKKLLKQPDDLAKR